MKNLTFKELLQKMKEKKQDYYFYLFKKNKDNCFGKCYKKNIANVNLLIKNANCNNTGAKIANGFNIAFDLFYGKKHNHKLIEGRPKEISKLTTRLDKEQILEIKEKLSLWSKDIDRILPCKQKATIVSRLRIYHTFCILVNSGMRIGEFVSIDFKIDISKLRTIESRITGEKFVEMIINTEKTKKKREIYMPVESFEFLKEDNWKKTRNGLQCGLDTFKAYANISYKLTWHTLRRTFATTAYGLGIDIDSIAMCLGNSPRVCQEYYIISSERNYDAFEIVNSYHNNKLEKTGNMYLKKFHKLKKK